MVAPQRRLALRDQTLIECGGTRNKSRSVSWNSTGQYLASGSSDRFAKIFSVEHATSGVGRELQSLTGHQATVERVRFHPTEPTVLVTAGNDATVRVWDARVAGASRCTGRIDLRADRKRYPAPCVASVEWHPGIAPVGAAGGNGGVLRYLVVAEKDDSVHVYDARRLSAGSTSSRGGRSGTAPAQGSAEPVRSFNLRPDVLQEALFSPSGTHLVAATKSGTTGMGEIRAWAWDAPASAEGEEETPKTHSTFVGHTGPIYTLRFSPDGTRLASGGFDSLVGLWDVESMVCRRTIARRTKFVRSVAFSSDGGVVATSTEEDGIDIADSETGEQLGIVKLWSDERRQIRSRLGLGIQGGGADELCFHPRSMVLACARGFEGHTAAPGGLAPPQNAVPAMVTVARLGFSSA